MKILHIIVALNSGGAEAVLCRLVAADAGSGHQHRVIALMDRGVYADRLEAAGCDVECLNMPRGRLTAGGLARLYRRIKAIQPDVVQTWMYHADLVGGIAARLAGAKTIVWGIRHGHFHKNKGRSMLVIWLCAWLSRWIPTRIASCSEHAVALHAGIGYRSDKITVIPNGYELDRVKPCPIERARIRAELGVAADHMLIGMIGRFDRQKDHGNLLRALKRIEDRNRIFTCVLVGAEMVEGNPTLRNLIKRAGLRQKVLLLGMRRDVPSIMNALDLHVLSSLGEGFPNVIAEAMLCGTPCVSTDVGDASLILGDTGWIAPEQNDALLAEAIDAACLEKKTQPVRWRERQQRSRARIVDNFSVAGMLAAYHRLWAEALASGAALPALSEKKPHTWN
jgi:glycosyltransferase involved in cell wall biosynthesis